MSAKKVTKKPARGATAAKKAAAKKPAARKPAQKAKQRPSAKAKPKAAPRASAKRAAAKRPAAKAASARPAIRRPDANLPPSVARIDAITESILNITGHLDDYLANLRALDRMRHNAVGLKRLGFIEAAFRISTNYPQYFPHWLNTEKFQRDLDLFNSIRSLVEAARSLEEKAWNINVESSDMIYTDALEYYSQVQDAAKRRIDSAESIYAELHAFFRGMGPHGTEEAPTVKKTKRDINALLKGKKDGEVIIRNIRPKTTGGTHEVIDETFRDSASFKETDKGSIIE